MRTTLLAAATAAALLSLSGCASRTPESAASPAAAAPVADQAVSGNPLLASTWSTPFGAIPFDQLSPAQIAEAMELGMAEQLKAIEAIKAETAAPNFANTVEALERSGALLMRAQSAFGPLAATMSNDEIRAIQSRFAPLMARHQSSIAMDAALFARLEAVHQSRESAGLTVEQQRLTDRYYRQFVRFGAKLTGEQRAQMAQLTAREAELMTKFSQNLLADTAAWTLTLEASDLDGLPDSLKSAAAQAAKDRGLEGKYLITLQRPSVEPFLSYSARRDLREKAWRAWIARGDNNNEYDNKAIIAELTKLRADRAKLLGFEHHSAFVMNDSMAGSSQAAMQLMEQVWAPALARAKEERAEMQALMQREGVSYKLEAWDWRYYAEKVRKARFDLSESELKPYFELENMLALQFHVAGQLFGLTFHERKDIPVYHPDVRVWEVKGRDGQHVGLFYGDFYAREGKNGGAWMSSLRRQSTLEGPVTPQVTNNLNYNKPPAGQKTLLSYDDAETLLHEFGHGLHGLLSNVTYASLSGTAVPRDFVEFPAQFMEHYLGQPALLKQFAKHYRTGEPMPDALIAKLKAAGTFNQGFATVEFLASALVDKAYHMLTPEQAAGIDPARFEQETLARYGMLPEMVMRHRSPHFSHVFAGGYSAGYYSYMWSEVLDADGFAAFKESGDIFNPALAERLTKYVYSSGGTLEPMQAYVGFRGAEPSVRALLENRGFPVQ